MLRLAIKDFKVQPQVVVLLIFMHLIMLGGMGWAYLVRDISGFQFSMLSLLTLYILVRNSFTLDEKNSTHLVISSLPLKPYEIVASKYLFLLMVVALNLFLIGTLSYLTMDKYRFVFYGAISYQTIVMTVLKVVVIVVNLILIDLMIIFKYGHSRTKNISGAVFVICIPLLAFVFNPPDSLEHYKFIANQIVFLKDKIRIIMALTPLVAVFSIMVSIKSFSKRDIT